MKRLKPSQYILIAVSVLILLSCIALTVCLLFSNYQTVRLFRQAQRNFLRGDSSSLQIAEAQLLQVIGNDADHEAAYVMLGKIAKKQKEYPSRVYYCYRAHRLNPLSQESKDNYVESLLAARYFVALENFLSQESSLPDHYRQYLYYAAFRNGNVQKYKYSFRKDAPWASLGRLFSENRGLSVRQQLEALKRLTSGDVLLKQEILALQADLYLKLDQLDEVERCLKEGCKLNPFVFSPVLGRFYANFRSFGKALPVLERYLEIYHDPVVALQTAEIYCLLKQISKIEELRIRYQGDEGKSAMLFCYYFDALIALAKNDMASLREFVSPLRESIHTPLSAFLFLCADLHAKNLSGVIASYSVLLNHRIYLDLQSRADTMVEGFLQRCMAEKNGDQVQLLSLARTLYQRKKDVFTAKFILLASRGSNGSLDEVMLKDALKRFPEDQGLFKIAIEHYLTREMSEAQKWIRSYKKLFPKQQKDMLRYEILAAVRSRKYDLASDLFRKNISPEILPEYWSFASSTMRETDLIHLSHDARYAPFCKALIQLKKGNRQTACDLLEKADAGGVLALLFFAARTLGENNRVDAALKKYALFPENSSYQLVVWMNMAELFAEKKELVRALSCAAAAYKAAPDLDEAQLCYADKLYKAGRLAEITDVINLSVSSPQHRSRKIRLWKAGVLQRIRECDINTRKEKIRELCRQLLLVDPNNSIALGYLKKITASRK